MTRVDLRKELKQLYSPSAKAVVEVQVPAFTYLMIDGRGDPNHASAYAEAVEALFTVSYTAKFMMKKSPKGRDYAVMPLEGLWWAEDLSVFHTGDRTNWQWTMMIVQPSLRSSRIRAMPTLSSLGLSPASHSSSRSRRGSDARARASSRRFWSI